MSTVWIGHSVSVLGSGTVGTSGLARTQKPLNRNEAGWSVGRFPLLPFSHFLILLSYTFVPY